MNTTHKKIILNLAFFLLLSLSTLGQKGFIKVDGSVFRDAHGRMVLLRGLNYVNKDQENKFLNLTKDSAFVDFKKWGYNAVRMGVNWSALEPAPGKYNKEYLQDLDTRMQYAKKHGIYVILDMHQDLYSIKFGNGAPLWATLDEGKPHQTGGIWSDAYYISPAVQTSFDNFWKNTPIADGIGIQDHYVKTWAMLAARYKNDKNLIGIDVMNEPFIGSAVENVLGILITKITHALNKSTTNKKYEIEEVAAMWLDEKGKNFILKKLTDPKVFVDVLTAIEPIYKEFEENSLVPFYNRLATAVRKVNSNHILFWEPSVSSNNGIPTSIKPIAAAGKQQGYIPHFYDIVLDTDIAGEADANRLSYMFYQLVQSTKTLQLPTLIGEWGAFYNGGQEVLSAAKTMVNGIDSLIMGDFYWSYFKGMENLAYFQQVLQRPYMQAATGSILKQTVGKNFYTITWKENASVKAKNLIYIPNSKNIKIEGKAAYKKIPLNNMGACILEIKSLKKSEIRTLNISWDK